MNEVSIKLQGGLGNYMFQIAVVYAYAIKTNRKAIFTTDNSFVAHKHITVYKNNILNKFDEFLAPFVIILNIYLRYVKCPILLNRLQRLPKEQVIRRSRIWIYKIF